MGDLYFVAVMIPTTKLQELFYALSDEVLIDGELMIRER